ncbi:hypothetical protein J5N97_020738 [Dioscorea zingiberensis]|uniref:Uncharacterized protein n=1 Tax=Dioscorea zingiberensis TaxID=325984 RepID=A0A9D5CH62_9LILI|nr:hypothetical protein J5N97_020738 [Dioscorea zingiberensis]
MTAEGFTASSGVAAETAANQQHNAGFRRTEFIGLGGSLVAVTGSYSSGAASSFSGNGLGRHQRTVMKFLSSGGWLKEIAQVAGRAGTGSWWHLLVGAGGIGGGRVVLGGARASRFQQLSPPSPGTRRQTAWINPWWGVASGFRGSMGGGAEGSPCWMRLEIF